MPPRLLPTFSPDSIRQIAEHIRRLEMQIGNLERRLAGRSCQLDDVGIWLGKTGAGGIAAATGTTVTTATVRLYFLPAGSTTAQDAGKDVTCHNFAGAVDANEYVIMDRDEMGRYWAIVERC